ncbi:hypothetical protein E2C01_069480 [Portunus trituberculatus]|uniref:Uncharacterized protein n=1 Tax=Portunus trituberculatus TaxID=210409 RepID=A0A5B7HYZ7_PORTR|nr:hypothetical protein [Portunus trituberculatus]
MHRTQAQGHKGRLKGRSVLTFSFTLSLSCLPLPLAPLSSHPPTPPHPVSPRLLPASAPPSLLSEARGR